MGVSSTVASTQPSVPAVNHYCSDYSVHQFYKGISTVWTKHNTKWYLWYWRLWSHGL